MSDCGGDVGGDYGGDIGGNYGGDDGGGYGEDIHGEIEDNYKNEEDTHNYNSHHEHTYDDERAQINDDEYSYGTSYAENNDGNYGEHHFGGYGEDIHEGIEDNYRNEEDIHNYNSHHEHTYDDERAQINNDEYSYGGSYAENNDGHYGEHHFGGYGEESGGYIEDTYRNQEEVHIYSSPQEHTYQENESGRAQIYGDERNVGDVSYNEEQELDRVENEHNHHHATVELDGHDGGGPDEEVLIGVSYDDRDSYSQEHEVSDHCHSESSENYNHRQEDEIAVDEVDGIEYPGIGLNGAEAVIISGAYGSRNSEREGGGRRNYRNYESRDRRYIQPVAYHGKGMGSNQGKRHRLQQTSQNPSYSSYRPKYSQNTTNYSEEYQPNKRLQATSILTLIAGLVFIAVGVCLLTVIEHADPVILNIFGGTCIGIGVILLLVGFTLVIKHRACCGQNNSRVIVLSVPQDTVGEERSRPPHHDRMTRTNQPPVSAGGYSIRETDMIQPAVNPYYPPSAPNLPEEMHDQRNFSRQNEKYIPYNGYPYVSPEITSPPPPYANIKQ